jgi:hypothetical protein
MPLPQGVCPQCQQHVEFVTVASAAGRLFRCCNCWHHLDDVELKHSATVSEKLAELELQRQEIITGAKRHANAPKNR